MKIKTHIRLETKVFIFFLIKQDKQIFEEFILHQANRHTNTTLKAEMSKKKKHIKEELRIFVCVEKNSPRIVCRNKKKFLAHFAH